MTEKEKAAAGYLYDANYDRELFEASVKCKDMCHKLNMCLPSDTATQREILENLIPGIPSDAVITAPFWCDYGYNIELGKGFFCNHNLVVLDSAKVKFGDFVFVAPNCCITTSGHALDSEQRAKGLEIAFPITVGNNVWIGANVCILPGITIGDNSVIGAGSVVNRNIPANVVAAGNPCRVIRQITDDDKHKYKIYE